VTLEQFMRYEAEQAIMKRVYDCIRRPHDPTARQYPHQVGLAALAARADLRSLCPPVYDQGELSACTGNGWAGAIEFLLRRLSQPSYTPSRLLIYLGERTIEGDVPDDAGATVADGAKTLETLGFCPETLWPYDVTQFAVLPPSSVYDAAKGHTIPSAQAIDNTQINQVKQALLNGLPVVFGVSVYESFESDAVAATGVVPMPGADEQTIGGHCMVIVGYDDATQTFIVRNSWGTSWGINGYCTMPYAYLTDPDMASDFWVADSLNPPVTA
jgi:C1A family cysteine protease